MCNKTNTKPLCQPFKVLVWAAALIMIPCLLSAPVLGADHSTGDGLTIGVTSEGRVDNLTFDDQSITFCYNASGGFYIRDYTPDSTGLPADRGSDNLITNPYFDSGLDGWTPDGEGDYDIEVHPRQVSGGETELAIVHLDELGSDEYCAAISGYIPNRCIKTVAKQPSRVSPDNATTRFSQFGSSPA